MQLLLNYSADPNASSEGCRTALQLATLKGNEAICNLLLKAIAGANPIVQCNSMLPMKRKCESLDARFAQAIS